MPKLLMPTSPCERCANLAVEETVYELEDGTSESIVLEFCDFQSPKKFLEIRDGVTANGKFGFPWCAFMQPKQKD